MERILAATESLIAEMPFESISVAAIVRRARTSVGAFYARFPKKEALLPALYSRRYGAAHRRRSLEYLEQLRARSLPLGELAAEIVGNMAAYYRFNALLLREMDLQAPRDPSLRAAAERDHQAAFHDGWPARKGPLTRIGGGPCGLPSSWSPRPAATRSSIRNVFRSISARRSWRPRFPAHSFAIWREPERRRTPDLTKRNRGPSGTRYRGPSERRAM
jgi:AcrR family transcriptional regulator